MESRITVRREGDVAVDDGRVALRFAWDAHDPHDARDARDARARLPLVRGLALCAAAVLLAACGATPAGRAGGAEEARTLTSATYFGQGYPSGDTLAYLSERVTELTDGALTLSQPPPPPYRSTDSGSEILRLVRDGDIDVAVVPTRVFDLVGVTSLQGLQAPFVFTSVEQADALLADPIAETMLPPLRALGVEGLALTYDALRNVVGYDGALTSPEDFAGQDIAFRPSAITRDVIAALGATEDPTVGGEFEERIAAGLVAGLEDSINQPNQQAVGTSVGNQFLGLKPNVIIVNSEVWQGLTDRQRDALTQAAVDARTYASTQMPTHMTLARAAELFCSQGAGDVVLASAEDTAAMRAAVVDVMDRLRSDPLTAAVIDRAVALDAELSAAERAAPCTGTGPRVWPWQPVKAKGDQSVLDGSWRIEVTAERLRAAGVDATVAANNEAVWTFTLADGAYRGTSTNGDDCVGRVFIRGDLVSTVWDPATGCGGNTTSRWTVTGDLLELEFVSGNEPGLREFSNAFMAGGLTRVS